MPSLTSRLSRLAASSNPLPAPPRPDPPASLDQDPERRRRIERLQAMIDATARRQVQRLQSQPKTEGSLELPGRVESTSIGPLRKIRTELEPEHHHGRASVGRLLQSDRQSMARVVLHEGELDPTRFVFLDTETTGLSTGAGTIPFLIGLGWFEEGRFVVEQLFLESLGDEQPMLTRVAEVLEGGDRTLVSFNGRVYDWPLLLTRGVLNRVALPGAVAHLDLYHAARRIHAGHLERTRLQDLEISVMGFRRERDIDGAEIPEAYWSYLRSRVTHKVHRILTHNLHDVVAMAALFAKLADGFHTMDRREEPEAQLGRGRLAARVGDHQRAFRFAVEAAEGGGDPACTHRAAVEAATAAQRLGRWSDAEKWWLVTLAEAEGEWELAQVHLALAKLYEHRLRRPASALRHAALSEPAEAPDANERRIRRLERRLPKTAPGPILACS
ncbi:MAG: ribonuclease H-like domain-containing protein [Myxococcota bacterium]